MNEYSEASIALEDKVLSSDIEAKGDRGRSQIGIQEEEKQKCFSIGITKGKQNNLQRTKRGGIIKWINKSYSYQLKWSGGGNGENELGIVVGFRFEVNWTRKIDVVVGHIYRRRVSNTIL